MSSSAADRPTLVHHLLDLAAAESGDRVAVVAGETLTFREWWERAGACAALVASSGLPVGARVALVFDEMDWAAFAAAYMGTLRAGCVAVPLNAALPPARADELAARAGAALRLDARTRAPAVAAVAAIGGGARAVRPDDAAEVLFTSGTGGAGRAVEVSHRNLLFGRGDLAGPADERGRPLTMLHTARVGTNFGQAMMLSCLARRQPVVVAADVRPDALMRALEAHDARWFYTSPPVAANLTRAARQIGWTRPEMALVGVTSAPATVRILRELAEVFPEAAVCNSYTSTEAWPASTVAFYEPGQPLSVGRPPPGCEVRVADAAGEELPPGSSGEILLRVAAADPRRYDGADRADGWVRTGDLGYVDADGNLRLVDRADDVIVSGGVNIPSLALEEILTSHPLVAEAAVVGLPHPTLGQGPVAVVVPTEEWSSMAADLRALVGARAPAGWVPQRFLVRDALPRNVAGKVRKSALREELARARPGRPSALRSGPALAAVLDAWRLVLDAPEGGPDDNFFDLGGDSVAAIRLCADLTARLGCEVTVDALYLTQTARLLADVLAREPPAQEAATTE